MAYPTMGRYVVMVAVVYRRLQVCVRTAVIVPRGTLAPLPLVTIFPFRFPLAYISPRSARPSHEHHTTTIRAPGTGYTTHTTPKISSSSLNRTLLAGRPAAHPARWLSSHVLSAHLLPFFLPSFCSGFNFPLLPGSPQTTQLRSIVEPCLGVSLPWLSLAIRGSTSSPCTHETCWCPACFSALVSSWAGRGLHQPLSRLAQYIAASNSQKSQFVFWPNRPLLLYNNSSTEELEWGTRQRLERHLGYRRLNSRIGQHCLQ